jgi:phenylalanyl-tRNA synthetase beta chain
VGDEDLRSLRGVVEVLLNKLDATRPVRVVPDRAAGYADGAAGRIEWGGKAIGFIGRISKAVADKLSLRQAPAAAEIDLPPLIAGTQHVPQLKPLPRFPAVRRDLTLDLADSTQFDAVESVIHSLKPPFLEDIEYVTTYRGKQVEQGKKSVTVALVFRSPTGTLTSEQVEGAVGQIIDAAKGQLGASLRG